MSEYPHRAVYVVDWDGTCVEEVWPGMGRWLPGAVKALRELSAKGKTVIYSLRCHEYEQDDCTLRPDGAAEAEYQAIRKMLDDAHLYNIEVYSNGRGKPPGRFYIDDRGVTFQGDWKETLNEIVTREFWQDAHARMKAHREAEAHKWVRGG